MAITNPGRVPGTSQSGIRTIWKTALTDVSDYDAEGVGAIRWEGNRCYKYVKYNEGAGTLDIVAGDALVYDAENYANSIVTADVSDGDTLPVPAGVALATVTATDKYMWIQIKGPVTVSVDAGGSSPGDGDAISAEVTGGTDKRFLIDPADNRARAGVVLDFSAKLYLLDCPY